ncbi:MAG TPA: hypothetical protein VF257_05250 [Solirubrobacteraceae bacterium]
MPLRSSGILLLLLVGLALVPAPAGAAVDRVTPRSAAAFRDSVGVNVHLSYYDTAYRNFTGVAHALSDLGVRQVRDGACSGCTGQNARLEALGRQGIGLTLIMGRPGGSETLSSLVGLVSGPLAPYVAGVEGPNEYDGSGDPRWSAKVRAYQRDLWRRMRAIPSLDSVPVLSPSVLSLASFSKLGNLSRWLDCVNVHPYAGGDVPSADLGANLRDARAVSGRKPVCATEAGYHNATADRGNHPGVSERAAAAYVPRLYLDFFRAGVERTFLYELVDEWPDPRRDKRESNFGLLRNDFSPKPAYRSLRELMRLTSPTARLGRLAPLPIAVEGGGDLHWQLLQTAPKRYSVVLWRDVRVWDQHRERPVPVTARRATLDFGQRVSVADVSVVDGHGAASTRRAGGRRHLSVDVGAYPVVARLRTPRAG